MKPRESVGSRKKGASLASPAKPLLSPLQLNILDCWDRGLRHKETAAALGKSVSAIRFQVGKILAKTGARSCTEANHQLRQAKAS